MSPEPKRGDPEESDPPRTMIEDAVMAPPEALGCPGASSIRNCRVSLPTGRVDVVLLPSARPVRLVLVEARAATSQDAASKVVGQFLMYYAGALMLGSKGLCALRRFAVDRAEQARSPLWISPRLLSGGISPPATRCASITGCRSDSFSCATARSVVSKPIPG